VGPFKYLNEADHNEVAKQLGVDPKDVWKVKVGIDAFQTAPRILEQPSSMYDEIIELDDQRITPSFTSMTKKVHPSIGIVDDRAYVGVQLPCICAPKMEPGKEGGRSAPEEEQLWFLVTSMKEKILCNKEYLKKLNWTLAYRPTILENRWSLESIKNFLYGDINVDPASTYFAVRAAWTEYIEFDKEAYYDLNTLWDIGTYFYHLFNTYPYIYFGGVKRTGKTKALMLSSVLCFNAISSGNVSTSSIFRLIQSGRCTFLMDETEKLINPDRAQDFRNLLLCGYKKGLPVWRTERTKKEKLVPEPFEVFSPKKLANIQGLENVTEDRVIPIIMKRGKNKAILNREVDINDPFWQEIRDQLYTLFLTYWHEVLEIYQNFEGVISEVSGVSEGIENISDRELELWKPLLCLAKFFDSYVSIPTQTTQTTQNTLFKTILDLAIRLTKEKRVENMTETGDYILVQTLVSLVKKDEYYKVKTIRDIMVEKFEEEPKWLNTWWIGRALKRLGFTDKRRLGKGMEYKLLKETVEDVAERLGVEKRLFEATDIVMIVLLAEPQEGKCGRCSIIGKMTRGAALFQNPQIPVAICDECAWELESSLREKGD